MVQVKACHLVGTKPLPEPEPMLTHCEVNPWVLTLMKFKSRYKILIHENAFEFLINSSLGFLINSSPPSAAYMRQ